MWIRRKESSFTFNTFFLGLRWREPCEGVWELRNDPVWKFIAEKIALQTFQFWSCLTLFVMPFKLNWWKIQTEVQMDWNMTLSKTIYRRVILDPYRCVWIDTGMTIFQRIFPVFNCKGFLPNKCVDYYGCSFFIFFYFNKRWRINP